MELINNEKKFKNNMELLRRSSRVDYDKWDSIYKDFLDFLLCGRLDLKKIDSYINKLLQPHVKFKSKNEKIIFKLKKSKLELLKANNPQETIKKPSVDPIETIKKYKSCVAMPILNDSYYSIKDTCNASIGYHK